jgi:mono/diheme cytochrome c family protein
MHSKRFLESSCLKCHHNVTELEPSERFPDPPAPKLMQGYQLLVKYGCYGCHEVNGHSGDDRVGPDLRLEPNYFAAAQAWKYEHSFEQLSKEEKSLVEQLIRHPDRNDVRRTN